ncbi:MAG TPA: hypothetical protein VFP12_09890 [Allosphingosinicella sp.]|nr:hypothetical protein [Allosphingosinicella sp.]
MPFTDEERSCWREEKKSRQRKQESPSGRPAPAAICVNCQNPFGYGEGVITEDAALCDICLGD